jgi:hypothetical protein
MSLASVFFTRAFVHSAAAYRNNLASKSLVCTFLVHAQNHNAYRLVHRPAHHFLESRDVLFNERAPALYACIVIGPGDTKQGGTGHQNQKVKLRLRGYPHSQPHHQRQCQRLNCACQPTTMQVRVGWVKYKHLCGTGYFHQTYTLH